MACPPVSESLRTPGRHDVTSKVVAAIAVSAAEWLKSDDSYRAVASSLLPLLRRTDVKTKPAMLLPA